MKSRLTATQTARQIERQQRLRQEAVDAVRASKRKRARGEEFDTLDKIAKDHKVTRQTLHAWVRAADKAGGVPPAPRRAGRPPRWAGDGATITGDLHRYLLNAAAAQRTTEALIDWFAARTGVRYAAASVTRMLWRLVGRS
jgi:transposase